MSDLQFPKSLKPIVNRGYNYERGGNIWRSPVQGGLPRQGRDTYYDAVPIGITLVMSALGCQVFQMFLNSIDGGASSFQMDLDTGNGIEPHNVLMTTKPRINTQDGINWVTQFTATAERTSIQDAGDFGEALWPLYGEYGDNLPVFLDYYARYCTTPNFINNLPEPR